jgi:hypothetical protein
LWRNIRFLPSIFAEKNVTKNEHIWVPKTLPTIWYTYMKLVTKYQIPVINICCRQTGSRNLTGPKTLLTIWSLWPNIRFVSSIVAEKNVHKNQLSQQTGSRNLTGPKTLPTIWHTYMKLVTKYQISTIDSCWEKCDEKYLGRTDRGKTVYPPPPSGIGDIKI